MKQYNITPASVHDLPAIYHLFDEAIRFQKENNYIGWKQYDQAFIQADVNNKLLLKITSDQQIAGIFSICFSDELIWRDREKGDALYLHRIVLNRAFKGEKIFGKVLEWAIQFAAETQLAYIRMDTWADNEKIIAYYKSYGFEFIENYTTPGTDSLPVQHRNLHVALLQLKTTQQEPTIFIIGAGAIGKTLAVFLRQEGRQLVLLRGHIDDGPQYQQAIEVQLTDNAAIKSDIPVSTLGHYKTLNGLIVITTKSHSNDQLAEKLKAKTGNSPILIVQNGLSVEQPFMENDFPEIYRCVLFASAQYTGDNKLSFKATATSPIGIIRGNHNILTSITTQLTTPCLAFQAEQNLQPVIWTKTIINSVFNTVCPLLETDNGIFTRNENAFALAKEIVDECIPVAESAGIKLNRVDVLDRLLLISKTSDGQLISTYQDILHKRKTEIEHFNIIIAQIADRMGQQHLTVRTKLLGDLIKIKSGIYEMGYE